MDEVEKAQLQLLPFPRLELGKQLEYERFSLARGECGPDAGIDHSRLRRFPVIIGRGEVST